MNMTATPLCEANAEAQEGPAAADQAKEMGLSRISPARLRRDMRLAADGGPMAVDVTWKELSAVTIGSR